MISHRSGLTEWRSQECEEVHEDDTDGPWDVVDDLRHVSTEPDVGDGAGGVAKEVHHVLAWRIGFKVRVGETCASRDTEYITNR